MPEIAFPADGSVRGPCQDGYMYYGLKPGCSCYDCRPNSSLARTLAATATAAPGTQRQPTTLRARIAYLLPGETTLGAPYFTYEPWDQLRQTAGEHGWRGWGETWRVTIDTTTGAEVNRESIGRFQL